jgi:hypothetical protein
MMHTAESGTRSLKSTSDLCTFGCSRRTCCAVRRQQCPLTPSGARPELGTDRWFAFLELQDGWFIQVGYGTRAGTRPGWYAVERHDGTSHAHHRTITSDLREVVAAFSGFTTDADWMQRFAWQPYELRH